MLRLIDANLDRLAEALRVLGEVSRFLLNDAQLTARLKTLRHQLIPTDSQFRRRLLTCRNTADDVGIKDGNWSQEGRSDVVSLVTANAKRSQESLRVLEEFVKLPEAPHILKQCNFEQARFSLYDIEKELTLKLIRQQKRQQITGLYVILDLSMLEMNSPLEIARQMIDGGAHIIQLRGKGHNKKEIVHLATELKELCSFAGVIFLINDHIDVALAIDADGVHLGQNDLPVSMARDIMPEDKLIGCTARTVAKAFEAQKAGADYVAVGSIYASTTKPDVPVVGLERIGQVKHEVTVPVVAIGGINDANIAGVYEAGASSVAVISAALSSADIKLAVNRLTSNLT